jgi:hypothetical protein
MRPLHIESRVTRELDVADAGGDAVGRRTSSRVVHEPGRGARLVAIVAVLGLVAGGAALVLRGTGEPPRAEDQADDPSVAYREAVRRLGYAGSFAYRGSVHAAGASAIRPGRPIATDVTVEGAVRLPQSITQEVAVDDRGEAVETVTSGSTAWSRSAPSSDRLAGAAWEVIAPSRSPDVGSPDRLGAALWRTSSGRPAIDTATGRTRPAAPCFGPSCRRTTVTSAMATLWTAPVSRSRSTRAAISPASS